MPLNKAMFWKVRAIPIAAASCETMSWNDLPRSRIVPFCGW